MFKKRITIVIGVLLVSLMVAGLAWADEGAPGEQRSHHHRRRGGGEITALGSDNFTVTGLRGNTKTVYVDSATQFLDQDVNPLTFADLQVGQHVAVVAAREDGDQTVAIWVRVFPPRTDYKGFGVVTGVNAAEQSFDFTNRRGQAWEFYVDAKTEFTDRKGGAHSFDELQAGVQVFVTAELRDDGKWWATRIGFRAADTTTQP